MRVSAPGQVQPATPRRSERRTGDSSFSSLISTEEGASVSGTMPAQAVAGVGAILALQQESDPLAGRRKGVRRASDLLGELEDIRRSLILGELSVVRLQGISQRLSSHDVTMCDPVLQQIIQDVELRVAVELAKRGVFAAG